MSRVSTYLKFERNTEEAFNFYQLVFGTEFLGPVNRKGEAPEDPVHPLRKRTRT